MLNLPKIKSPTEYSKHFNSEVWLQAAKEICARHNIPHISLQRTEEGENIIFFLGADLVLKIYKPFRDCFAREMAALNFMSPIREISSPEVIYSGEIEGWEYLVMSRLKGENARAVWEGLDLKGRCEIAENLGSLLKALHGHRASHSLPKQFSDWEKFIGQRMTDYVDQHHSGNASPEWLQSMPAYISDRAYLLEDAQSTRFLHGDVHLGNFFLQWENGCWRISGIFDFGDVIYGAKEYDFVAPGVLMFQGNQELQRAFLLAYGFEEPQLDVELRAKLMLLTILYECSNLRKYALRLAPEAVDLTLAELETAIWKFC